MLKSTPRYVVFTGTFFALSLIASAFCYLWRAFDNCSPVAIPFTLADSASYQSAFVVDVSGRYEVTLELLLPQSATAYTDERDPVKERLEQIRVRQTMQCHGLQVSSQSESVETHVSSYAFAAEGIANVGVQNFTRYELDRGEEYQCTITYHNVPNELLGTKACLTVALVSVEYESFLVSWWLILYLAAGITIITGIIFVISCAVWRSNISRSRNN